MKNWIKHKKDKIEIVIDGDITIVSCSRHDRRGKLLGYIVKLTDGTGFEQIQFKHYRSRWVAVTSMKVEYKLRRLSNRELKLINQPKIVILILLAEIVPTVVNQ